MGKNILVGHIKDPLGKSWDVDTSFSVEEIGRRLGYTKEEITHLADGKYMYASFNNRYLGVAFAGQITLPKGVNYDNGRMFYGIYCKENIPALLTLNQIKNEQGLTNIFSCEFISPFCYCLVKKDGEIDYCRNILRWEEDGFIMSNRQKWIESSKNVVLFQLSINQKKVDYRLHIDYDSVRQIKKACKEQIKINPKEYLRWYSDFVIKTRRAIDADFIEFIKQNNIEMIPFIDR